MGIKSLLGALSAAGVFSAAQAKPYPEQKLAAGLADAELLVQSQAKRGAPVAPDGYTPAEVNCPSTRPSLRVADGLSQSEADWLQQRRPNTLDPMKELLGRLNIQGLDTTRYIDDHSNNISSIPNIAIAASGGGWRALLNGAGAVAAFDSRTEGATGAGQLGGLLQSSTYIAGLSGGSWLVGSIYMNNFSTVPALLNNDARDSASGFLWGFQESIVAGPPAGGLISNIVDTADYYTTIYNQVSNKEDLDYNTTITDYWGRALSFQLINATDGGPAYTWSSLAGQSFLQDGSVPLPLVVADGRAPGQVLISLNATNYEFTPWELGSWDPQLYGFAPLEYVGSEFRDGQLPDTASCVRGFDSASYVMGTSSSLFNQLLLNLGAVKGSIPSVFYNAIDSILSRLGSNEEDIADWDPNPFFGWRPETNPNARNESLTLVDGGEDLQNIPLTPLIQPVREVDVIFAIDSSADTSNWPNGTALVASYERSLEPIANGTSFPAVPAQNSFVNLGLNNRPTFFGCDVSNTSSETPLIVYIPNSPYVYHSNVSTFQLDYTKEQQRAIVENGYNVATMGNGTRDDQWPTCVGCAILQRSLLRTNTQIPDVCNQCFDRYCWNGTVANQEPAQAYEPAYALKDGIINATSSAPGALQAPTMVAMSAAAFFSWLLL